MKIIKIIESLSAMKLYKPAYMILSTCSFFLGQKSKFELIDNDLWLHKQGNTFYFDYTPNYRLVLSEIEALCEDIYFHSYTPKKGDVCIDIGAGIGTDTRLMSQLVGMEGKVFSIEPATKTFKALELSVKYNQLENVISSQLAISNRNTPVKLSEEQGHHTESTIVTDDAEIFSLVDGITIDEYLESNNISIIDYMKVNIDNNMEK